MAAHHSHSSPTNTFSQNDDSRLAAALNNYQRALEQGKSISIDEFVSGYQDIREKLKECLSALAYVNAAITTDRPEGRTMPILDVGSCIGDFEIVREIGRGGMGIVYEAQQLSIGRSVAIKVLPSFASAQPRMVQRFHHEAQANGTNLSNPLFLCFDASFLIFHSVCLAGP